MVRSIFPCNSDFLFKFGHSNDKKRLVRTLTGELRIVKARTPPAGGFRGRGGAMRANKSVGLKYRASTLPKTGAKIYDFSVRQTESIRHRRIRILEHENRLLTRVVSATRSEILRLRKLLAAV
jgi:hypothetical protein